ncbi:MAG: glutamine--tRNA ligase, partial [Oscillospiraceae bacterium]|nr:glutamine--tRNA ligase [Oscillospiraceae bacterium]
TIQGLKRRGYTPSALTEFVNKAGYAKAYSIVDIELLEHCIRDELNMTAARRMAVIDPIKLTITNVDSDLVEAFTIANNPNDPDAGTREVTFTNELYIERSDFEIDPPNKFYRLSVGKEVRLMGAYIVRCNEYVLDEDGKVVELLCSADLESGGKNPPDGRKIKGTIHWVSTRNAIETTIYEYGRLFTLENMQDMPDDSQFSDFINSDSVKIYENAKLEAALDNATLDERYQFVRTGYFIKDSKHENAFNSIVGLRDSWAKINR